MDLIIKQNEIIHLDIYLRISKIKSRNVKYNSNNPKESKIII